MVTFPMDFKSISDDGAIWDIWDIYLDIHEILGALLQKQ
jgi:hypothetical protein